VGDREQFGIRQPGEPVAWRSRVSVAAAGVRADWTFAAIDVFLVAMSYLAASMFRLMDPSITRQAAYWDTIRVAVPLIVMVHVVANALAGAYGHVWEFASVAEARRVIVGNVMAGGVIVGSAAIWDLTSSRLNPIPLSVLVMGASFTVAAMGAVRFRSRLFSFNRARSEAETPRALIVGADAAGARFAQSAQLSGKVELMGFVDPQANGDSRHIAGLPVLGSLRDLRDLIRSQGIDQVIIGHADDSLIRTVVDACLDNEVRLSLLPDLEEMISGRNGIRDPRDLEVADLLPRPVVDIDLEQVSALITDKRILITGAGGSIGSEILRQVIAFQPEAVIALDNDESHLHDAMLTIEDTDAVVQLMLCDIRDRRRLEQVFSKWKPAIVFHAAAHKHVPILEQHPEEAIKTNVIGTANVIAACRDHRAEQMVLISTDKAVAPVSVMGATKRVAEMLVQAAALEDDGCLYSAVRFGNVLGSRGSVVPTFVAQIKRGGPVTITDPDMTRFFMTTGEAVQLVIQSAAMAIGGEVHVLDMGEPVRIIDLAHRMIRLAGLVPGRDIAVEIVGARPGEKLSEQLALTVLEESDHPRVRLTRPQLPLGRLELESAIAAFRDAIQSGDEIGSQALLYRLLEMAPDHPSTPPTESVVSWN
jgi:FlaA1/EpsC-like NDP-sugar epimerase